MFNTETDDDRRIEDVRGWIKTFEGPYVHQALLDFRDALVRGERDGRTSEIVDEWHRIYSELRNVGV